MPKNEDVWTLPAIQMLQNAIVSETSGPNHERMRVFLEELQTVIVKHSINPYQQLAAAHLMIEALPWPFVVSMTLMNAQRESRTIASIAAEMQAEDQAERAEQPSAAQTGNVVNLFDRKRPERDDS